MKTHGLSKKSAAYVRWKTMKARCLNPKHDNYAHYGGKGITIDPLWLKFENFLQDMGEPPKGRILDRINSKAGYSKDNCRWVTCKESTENRSNTIWIEGMRLEDFAKSVGLNYSTVWQRLNRMGWTIDEIKLYPFRVKKQSNLITTTKDER